MKISPNYVTLEPKNLEDHKIILAVRNYGLRKMAKYAGIHPGHLSRFLRGTVGLNKDRYDKMREILGL